MKKIVIFILLMLIPVRGFAAEVVRYVNCSSAGGNGTTNNESGADAAYASLSAWEAAEETDLVTDGDTHKVYCDDGSSHAADTTAVTIDGWTTDSDNDITIEGDNTTGKWDTNYYRIDTTGAVTPLSCDSVFITVNNIQLGSTNTSGTTRHGLAFWYRGDMTANNVVIKLNTTNVGNGVYILNNSSGTQSYTLNNCIIYNVGENATNGIRIDNLNNDTVALNNCTISGYTNGVAEDITDTGFTLNVYNSAVFNNTDDFKGNNFSSIDYCASDDGDGTNAVDISPNATESDDWANAFTNYVNGDFSVKDTSSVLYNAGTTIASVTDDIIGTSRPQSTDYDIGAFEYQSGAPSTIRINITAVGIGTGIGTGLR